MELLVLGGNGTWPSPGGATAGYLLRHDGFNLWLDMGSGTMASLQQFVGMTDVNAVVVSHAHPDHIVDLYPLFYALFFHPDKPEGLPLFMPPGAFERAGSLISESGMQDMSRIFAIHEIAPGQGFEVGPFRFSTAPMLHPIATLGMRIEADGTALAYSADTGPTEELIGLARGAELLLSEATWLERPEGMPPLHLTASEAGDHAARAEVGGLILTHIWPSVDHDHAKDQAGEAYHGPIQIASGGLSAEI